MHAHAPRGARLHVRVRSMLTLRCGAGGSLVLVLLVAAAAAALALGGLALLALRVGLAVEPAVVRVVAGLRADVAVRLPRPAAAGVGPTGVVPPSLLVSSRAMIAAVLGWCRREAGLQAITVGG